MLTGLIRHGDKIKFLLKDHSPTILTGVGVGGTVATAYLTGRASFKAAKLIEQEKQERVEELKFPKTEVVEYTWPTKLKMVWKLYIPPVGAGAVTITSIIAANKISSTRIAALAAAAGISERALAEYKEKVMEKLGPKQDEKIRDEIAQDRINQNPPGSREVIVAGSGDVLCFDMHTGRYFQSSMEEMKRAENKVNHSLIQFMHASASEFYDEIGLPPSSYTDMVGWNANNQIELIFSSALTPDNRPCLAMDFKRPPTMEYARHYD
jgi:hypothetical protein